MRAPATLLSLALLAAAGEPEITSLSVDLDEHRVLVDFELANSFDDEIVEQVQSGLPTGFLFRVELLKDRKRWFDRPLQDSTLQVVALYDAVSREYLVNFKLDGKLIESRVVQTLDDLETALTRFEDIPVFVLGPQPRQRRLLVRVRAELDSSTWLLFFPVRATTGWTESKKFRPPPDLLPGGATN